jgi:hypothetical protein
MAVRLAHLKRALPCNLEPVLPIKRRVAELLTKQSSGTTFAYDPAALVTDLARLRRSVAPSNPACAGVSAFSRPSQEAE